LSKISCFVHRGLSPFLACRVMVGRTEPISFRCLYPLPNFSGAASFYNAVLVLIRLPIRGHRGLTLALLLISIIQSRSRGDRATHARPSIQLGLRRSVHLHLPAVSILMVPSRTRRSHRNFLNYTYRRMGRQPNHNVCRWCVLQIRQLYKCALSEQTLHQ
jgi:hypothetical protein